MDLSFLEYQLDSDPEPAAPEGTPSSGDAPVQADEPWLLRE